MKPTRTNAVLICDKCGFIFREWEDKCPECKHDLVNVCLSYNEAKQLRAKIKPKSKSHPKTNYRSRTGRPREVGPKVIAHANGQGP